MAVFLECGGATTAPGRGAAGGGPSCPRRASAVAALSLPCPARVWAALSLLLLAAILLCGCRTLTQADPGGRTHQSSLPPGLRSAGLALHHLNIAAGLYVRRAEADETIFLSRPQALAGLRRKGDSVTWLGHSSVLLRLGGISILTDPVLPGGFSLRSPLPHRHATPPLRLDDLPRVDIVIISHGDYDHLHTPTLAAIARRFPGAVIFLPDGLERYGEDAGFRAVYHPKAPGTVVIGQTRISAYPAVHGTRRNLAAKLDGQAYAWDVHAAGRSVLFVGDSARGPVFGEIGRREGPHDLALVPIGAFEPSPLVAEMHSTPEDSARILAEVRARLGIGIHWGTFALSPEPLRAPAERFLAAANGRQRLKVLRIGETIPLSP